MRYDTEQNALNVFVGVILSDVPTRDQTRRTPWNALAKA